MAEPKSMRATNPQTGKMVKETRCLNIYICGLTKEEKEILQKSLPEKKIEITDVTGDVTCIVEKSDFAVIINTDNVTEEELAFFVEFYSEFDGCTETIFLTGSKSGVERNFSEVKTVVYKDCFAMEQTLKFELLQAYQKTTKSEGYSEKLALLLQVLFAIRNKPYITTKELAEKTERSTRTVQRYIETLRCAGEFIGYDRNKKGWYLVVDGNSVLMNDF